MSDESSPNIQTEAAQMREAEQGFVALPLWRRFHFRTSLVLGLVVGLLIAVVGYFTYCSIVESEMVSFRRRLYSIALVISRSIEPSELKAVIDSPAVDSPAYRHLHDKLADIAAQETDVESIYVMLPTAEPGKLRFLMDASKLSRVANRDESYDASEMPFMLQGFNKVSVEDHPFTDEFGTTQSSYGPLRDADGKGLGLVGVDVLAVKVEHIRSRVLWLCIALFGCAILVMVGLSYWLGRQIRRPLGSVVQAASLIAEGRFDVPLQIERKDEFGLLAERFQVMASNLRDRERLRETFGLYISRELADSLLKEGKIPALGGMECVATILFIDVRSFTLISEKLSPTETISMLNDYLSAMVDVIKRHRGCTLDFIGDAIITVFGAPFYQPDHAVDAVRCATEMIQRMRQLNAEWVKSGLARRWQQIGLDDVGIRVGVHTGSLVAGNIGSASRMKYSVIGDTVNIAARLESLNKDFGSTILLSEEVHKRLPMEMSANFVDHGQVELRGRTQHIRVFAVPDSEIPKVDMAV